MLLKIKIFLLRILVFSTLSFLAATSTFAAKYTIDYNSDIVGDMQVVIAKQDESFADIARIYSVPFNTMATANPELNPWGPGEGQLVSIPGRFILPNVERKGIVINLAEFRLYYFPENEPNVFYSYPIGIGEESNPTPILFTQVIGMRSDPTWYVPESIREPYLNRGLYFPKRVPAGPDNPLGEYAIRLGMPNYLIHGTNADTGVGMRVSKGCIRLYPEDIKDLFSRVDIDTPVQIIHQPYKTGWERGQMYLEVHQELIEYKAALDVKLSNIMTTIHYQMLKKSSELDIDSDHIEQIMKNSEGIPTKIGKQYPISRLLN